MNYGEVIENVKNIIDETDEDTQIDSIIKSSVNEAYQELCRVDIKLSTSYIPVINGIATLPDDLINIVDISPKLTGTDRIVGNFIISSLESEMYTVIYNYRRDVLSAVEDELDLDLGLHYALVMYASSIYFKHRKRVELSQLFNMEYQTIKATWQQDKDSNLGTGESECVVSVYDDYTEI